MVTIEAPAARGRWRGAAIGAGVIALALTVGWWGWSRWRAGGLRAEAGRAAGRGEWARAGDLLDRLAWYAPRDRQVLGLRVRAAFGRGDPLGAARFLATTPDSAPEAVDARLSAGRIFLESFRPREAEAALRDGLRIDPEADDLRLALLAVLGSQYRGREYEAEAWALLDRGREPVKALRLLAQAAPAIPADTFARTADLGDVLLRCHEADPDDPHARLALAHFERGRGRVAEALALLAPLLAAPPAPPEATLEWVACLLDEGEIERLDPLFTRPPESLRGLAALWILRGEWARRGGRDVDALDDYREAVRLDPRPADAHYRLARALQAVGDEAGAARERAAARAARELIDLVATIPDRPRDPAPLDRAASLCAEAGRDREARAWRSLAARSGARRAPR